MRVMVTLRRTMPVGGAVLVGATEASQSRKSLSSDTPQRRVTLPNLVRPASLRGVLRRSSPSRYSTASVEALMPDTSEKPARLIPSISTWYRNTL